MNKSSLQKNPGSPPLFSVVSVTLNNLDGLKRTEQSLQQQTFKNMEWIVMDGGSSDGSVDYLASHPSAIWLSAPDSGIYDAMNRAIPRINGQFCLFLNAGDTLATPDMLEKIAAALEKNPDCQFLYGDSYETAGREKFFKPAHKHNSYRWGMFAHHQAMLYAAPRLKTLHYNTAYEIAGDYDLTLRFIKGLKSVQIARLPFAICLYQCGGVSQIRAHQGRMEQLAIRHALNICPAPHNLLIFALQWLVWQVRRYAPMLYWAFKSCSRKQV